MVQTNPDSHTERSSSIICHMIGCCHLSSKIMLRRLPFKRTYFTTAACLDRHIKTSKERRAYFDQTRSWKATEQQEHVNIEEPRMKKNKAALMLGFNGSAYQGMQV